MTFSSIAGSISYFLCFMNSWISYWVITTAFVHGWFVVPPLHCQYPHCDMLILFLASLWYEPDLWVGCVWTFSKEVKLVRCHPFTFYCYSFEFFTIHCRISINLFRWCFNFKKKAGERWALMKSPLNEDTSYLLWYESETALSRSCLRNSWFKLLPSCCVNESCWFPLMTDGTNTFVMWHKSA